MNEKSCPVCSQRCTTTWLRKEDVTIVSCKSCGMKYVQDGILTQNYYETEADQFYASEDKVRGDYAVHRSDRELNALAKYCVSGKVLDVGCSTGGFLYQAQLRFGQRFDCFGTDVAPTATSVAKEHGVKVIETDFLNDTFPERNFQAITFWAVLEHVPEPSIFVNRAHELLDVSGLVFVVVPNVDSLAIRLLRSRYRYIMAEHLNYFSRDTLVRLFEPSFRKQHIATSHFNPIVILQDLKRARAPAPGERAQLLNRTNARKSMPVLKPFQIGYKALERALGAAGLADNILAVFKKG